MCVCDHWPHQESLTLLLMLQWQNDSFVDITPPSQSVTLASENRSIEEEIKDSTWRDRREGPAERVKAKDLSCMMGDRWWDLKS